MLSKKKMTVHDLQVLCSFLNFLGKAVFPGRAFTRRMYAKYSKYVAVNTSVNDKFSHYSKLKQYHHVHLDTEFKRDGEVWLKFLTDDNLVRVVSRPMVDLTQKLWASEISFYSDASAACHLEFGCILNSRWIFGAWGEQFMDRNGPSIEYLELFGLCAGVLT